MLKKVLDIIRQHDETKGTESEPLNTRHHGLPCSVCGDRRPDRHCHSAEERSAAIKAKGGFDWMQATSQ